jgi:(R,R)-butanediol dehydrogenase/meso-butanediol dehydrogenase/diacetyl reductase
VLELGDRHQLPRLFDDLNNDLGLPTSLSQMGVVAADLLPLAPQLAAAQGTVVITGLHDAPVGINLFPTVCKEITIKGSFSHIYDQDFAAAVRVISSAQLDPSALITRRIAIDDIVRDGFEALLHDKSTHLKILIQPSKLDRA